MSVFNVVVLVVAGACLGFIVTMALCMRALAYWVERAEMAEREAARLQRARHP